MPDLSISAENRKRLKGANEILFHPMLIKRAELYGFVGGVQAVKVL